MNIMFVCTGNTCRSAMAEGLAKKLIDEKKLDINVSSSGIFAMKGEHASFNSVAIMKEYDVDIVTHTATPIEESNIEKMDYIFGATYGHKSQIIARYPDLKDKVYTMKELKKSNTNRVVCGVCGGLGEYFNVDPTVVRLLWIAFSLMGGSGILAYIIAAVIMPENN